MKKSNFIKIIDLIEVGDYGKAIDNLISIKENYINVFDSKQQSYFYLSEAILWELLKNLPKAQENYEIALKRNPNNLLSLQYLAHILSTKGEYPKSIRMFDKLFQKRKDGNNPFSINRGFLGFRYRMHDINLLEQLEVIGENSDLKYTLLSLYYLSIYDLQRSLNNLKKVRDPTPILRILEIIADFFYPRNGESIKELVLIKLEEENELNKKINSLISNLSSIEHKLPTYSIPYEPKFSQDLYNLIKDVQGWLDYCEGNLLYQISKNLKKTNLTTYIVEIGSFLGRSTIFMSKGLKERGEGVLLSIDPHNGIPYYHPEPTFKGFTKNLKERNLSKHVQILRGTSEEWSTRIKDKISMIFIDGDHSYEMVKLDFINWEPKLINGGYIAFHDAFLDGPFKLISEIVQSKRWNFLLIVGNLALLKKKSKQAELKIDLRSILNLILLHINHLFHLNFIKNDNNSMKNQVITLLKILEHKI